ncbi:Lsr2 family protein [Cryobacterium sp. TMT1-21]|uniref:histone-like nucleoid-structuring protein Lsr2 n=1 Tax=Cryobacterium sp. TMT1-21 TaxID=1259234 RepID=UPI0010695DDF|nr:Lsr2 family protein [Cryobacterium sp. TMT1-21]TFD14170.1 Lsr2 family protein [Cryobacterium sp. TMT1-21]
MAKKTETITHYVDDLDGTSYDEGKGETVKFSLDQVAFEIDLSEKNAKEFRRLFTPYVTSGRTVARATRGASSATNKYSKEELLTIRLWANDNGYTVSSRGRVPQAVIDAYKAAH